MEVRVEKKLAMKKKWSKVSSQKRIDCFSPVTYRKGIVENKINNKYTHLTRKSLSLVPTIFHKTWQTEIPTCYSATPPADICLHCSSPSGLPTNCGAPFSTLPESLTSLTVHLRAHLPVLHSHENKRILMGT